MLGPGIVAGIGNGLILGWLMLRSGLVPRRLALLGVIGGPILAASGIAVVLGVIERGSPAQGLATIPDAVWEIGVMGLYLIFVGFRAPAVARLLGRSPGETGPAPAAPSTRGRVRGRGRCGMSAQSQRAPMLPPRLVIRVAWVTHRAIHRFTGGRVGLRPAEAGKRFGMLRLTSIGRRTGQPRVAIVGYLEDGPNLVTLAMNGWADAEPAWWLNLQAQPETVVSWTTALARSGLAPPKARNVTGSGPAGASSAISTRAGLGGGRARRPSSSSSRDVAQEALRPRRREPPVAEVVSFRGAPAVARTTPAPAALAAAAGASRSWPGAPRPPGAGIDRGSSPRPIAARRAARHRRCPPGS